MSLPLIRKIDKLNNITSIYLLFFDSDAISAFKFEIKFS